MFLDFHNLHVRTHSVRSVTSTWTYCLKPFSYVISCFKKQIDFWKMYKAKLLAKIRYVKFSFLKRQHLAILPLEA